MLNNPQIERMLSKLKNLEKTMEPFVFTKQDTLPVTGYETKEFLHDVPAENLFIPFKHGDTWGGERSNCWFRGSYTVKSELAGKPLYIWPKFGSYETMLWVNNVPFGTFANKICMHSHGNHYCDMFKLDPKANETIEIALEAYAGQYVIGTQPFEHEVKGDFRFTFESVDICTKNQDIADFIFDLRALNQLTTAMDKDSFRRGDVVNCLAEVHKIVYYSPDHTDEPVWRAALAKAREIMRPLLQMKNSESAPSVGLIGHSHMDTAWLWDIAETVRKCARTYANQLNLMEQYPEYKFIQSSAYHAEMIRRYYPELFKRIQEAVKQGKYEPNGAVWVECDCNITSGESMVRQFLWGQKYTQKYFDFTSDCFWLPDTFGYSAAIPQIMKGCNVDYFLTTKISWNDTTKFPYESFKWEGIDGSNVLVHFNTTHNFPDPLTLIGRTEGHGFGNELQQKTVSKKRLVSYGFGDGGGGPQFEMVEIAKRCTDLEGCPKAEHTTVSAFMKDLEKTIVNPNTYAGELYLELHRGTLTNQHVIKSNNRKAEIAIRNAEILTVANAVKKGEVASDKAIRPQLETLLVNQFHDILPGTCIQTAHEQSEREMAAVIKDTNAIIASETANNGDKSKISLVNTLPFDFDDVIYVADNGCLDTADTVCQQKITDMDGNKLVAAVGLTIPAMSSISLAYGKKAECANKNFTYENGKVTTPFAEIIFNEKGYIKSFVDTRNNRQLVGENGYAFNTFLLAEDVPSSWDNWDVDADLQMKFADTATLVKEEVVSNGAVQLRIRRTYKLTELTTLKQDMIFHAHTPRVDFVTEMDWKDKRRFLKVAFDTTVLARQSRHEIQFGYVCKPTTRNSNSEQAMFEVVNHKYSDISETKYGCAILNDCKYGISVEGGNMRLSLHKSGIRPDPRGDNGVHKATYSFLPHNEGFGTNCVIKPAYMLNYAPIVAAGEYELPTLVKTNVENVIIEAIKPCEENERAFIVRMYEAEGTFANSTVTLGLKASKVEETNMLEEVKNVIESTENFTLNFKPFEIKTIKVTY